MAFVAVTTPIVRIARKRFLTFVRQSQTDASPIRLGSLSDQVPTCLKRLNGLWCGADRDAAHKLVTSHLRLVTRIARDYRGYGLPISEAISEGNVGLMQADG
jgi:DNA-directed RNA polymerase sigma subunit (sigma70/sigma32)